METSGDSEISMKTAAPTGHEVELSNLYDTKLLHNIRTKGLTKYGEVRGGHGSVFKTSHHQHSWKFPMRVARIPTNSMTIKAEQDHGCGVPGKWEEHNEPMRSSVFLVLEAWI